MNEIHKFGDTVMGMCLGFAAIILSIAVCVIGIGLCGAAVQFVEIYAKTH